MPLGRREGDKIESRYCGVETEFSDDMPRVLAFNISPSDGFDFVVAPLVRLLFTPTLIIIVNGGQLATHTATATVAPFFVCDWSVSSPTMKLFHGPFYFEASHHVSLHRSLQLHFRLKSIYCYC